MKKNVLKKTLASVTTLVMITVLFQTMPNTGRAEEPPYEEPGWVIDGTGTYFEITNSSYRNVTLSSSEYVHIHLESIPKMILYFIERNCSANSTVITLSNLEANKNYYFYQDGNLIGQITTDENGSYSYTSDLTTRHQVFIQENTSTIYINSDGTIDPSTAPISRNGDTYTLTANISETIQINKPYITLDGAGYSIQGVSGSLRGILIPTVAVHNVTIENIHIRGFTIGIHLGACDSITIKESNTSNNIFGIRSDYSYYDTIKDNIVSNNQYGIWPFAARYTTIMNNTVFGNSNGGVSLIYTYDTLISKNIFSHNKYAISTYGKDNWHTTITNNTFSHNDRGLTITYLHNSPIMVTFNIFSNNTIGIYLLNSQGDKFHHNNFIENTYQFYLYGSSGWAYWDDGYGEGNYWSDYTGVDDGSNGRTAGDGVGDTLIPHPYTNRGGGYYRLDNYPLMSPWSFNDPPVADANGPYAGNEGSAITFNASGSTDPNGDFLQYRWDFNNDGSWDTSYSTNPTASQTWYDDYSGTVVLEVYDGVETDTATSSITINNVAPTITVLTSIVDPVQIGTSIPITSQFTDPGSLDTHTATINWDDGTIITKIVQGLTVSEFHIYTTAGVYTLSVTVTDDNGGSDTEIYQYAVIFDPTDGFVTGGGWIISPTGAYTLDPSLTGAANFGFVSKYKKGQNIPSGNTEFNFNVANMNFHSENYDWLVIAGAKAMYKGTGTINGLGNYGFLLSAIDEELTQNTDVDLFRIKIWDKNNNNLVIYDNQLGAGDDSDPTTAIAGGNIKIHTN